MMKYQSSKKNIVQYLLVPQERILIEILKKRMDGKIINLETIKIFQAKSIKQTKESNRYKLTKEISTSTSGPIKLPKVLRSTSKMNINMKPNKICLINIPLRQVQFLQSRCNQSKKKIPPLEDPEQQATWIGLSLCIQNQQFHRRRKVILMDFPSSYIQQRYQMKKIQSQTAILVRVKVNGKQKWKFRAELIMEQRRERKKDKKSSKSATTLSLQLLFWVSRLFTIKFFGIIKYGSLVKIKIKSGKSFKTSSKVLQ